MSQISPLPYVTQFSGWPHFPIDAPGFVSIRSITTMSVTGGGIDAAFPYNVGNGKFAVLWGIPSSVQLNTAGNSGERALIQLVINDPSLNPIHTSDLLNMPISSKDNNMDILQPPAPIYLPEGYSTQLILAVDGTTADFQGGVSLTGYEANV